MQFQLEKEVVKHEKIYPALLDHFTARLPILSTFPIYQLWDLNHLHYPYTLQSCQVRCLIFDLVSFMNCVSLRFSYGPSQSCFIAYPADLYTPLLESFHFKPFVVFTQRSFWVDETCSQKSLVAFHWYCSVSRFCHLLLIIIEWEDSTVVKKAWIDPSVQDMC